jgi:hypothetical protein
MIAPDTFLYVNLFSWKKFMKSNNSYEHRILTILLDGQIHHASEFAKITHRFNVCMQRLREDGHNIKTLPLEGRNKPASYQLISKSVTA